MTSHSSGPSQSPPDTRLDPSVTTVRAHQTKSSDSGRNENCLEVGRIVILSLLKKRRDQLRQVEDIAAEVQAVTVHLLHQFR